MVCRWKYISWLRRWRAVAGTDVVDILGIPMRRNENILRRTENELEQLAKTPDEDFFSTDYIVNGKVWG